MSSTPFRLLISLSFLAMGTAVHGFGLKPGSSNIFQRRLPVVNFLKDGADVELPPELPHSLAFPKKALSTLIPLNYEFDIQKFIDISRPYYALENEHKIIDSKTGEVESIICTAMRDMPTSRDSGGISCAEVGRHMAAAATIAASLKNPQKKRFHYLASHYQFGANPYYGKAKQEIPDIERIFEGEDVIIFSKCTEISKRCAKCEVYLETNDVTWYMTIDLSIISDIVFKKMHPPSTNILKHCIGSIQNENPYSSMKESLHDKKVYTDISNTWVTMEARMPPSTPFECKGHFDDNAALPHSVMLYHNFYLLGNAISELTGTSIPFKCNDFSHTTQDSGIQILNWECLPENLHFASTFGLEFQCKVFLSKGEMGAPGSIYVAECSVKQEVTGKICYKATGSFILNPGRFLKEAFRDTFIKQNLIHLWSNIDTNGDGVISHQELDHFIANSNAVNLNGMSTQFLFAFIDRDGNGEISLDELTYFYDNLGNSSKV